MTETTEQHITLPDKPSELIDLALRDLADVESDPNYCVEMEVQWHASLYWYQSGRPKCAVCLAGAVMARSLHAPPNEIVTPAACEGDYPTLDTK